MPRLLTGDLNNKMYVAIEVALCCYITHTLAKSNDMRVKAILTGVLFALYEMYLDKRNNELKE